MWSRRVNRGRRRREEKIFFHADVRDGAFEIERLRDGRGRGRSTSSLSREGPVEKSRDAGQELHEIGGEGPRPAAGAESQIKFTRFYFCIRRLALLATIVAFFAIIPPR